MSAVRGSLVVPGGTEAFTAPATITLRDTTRSDDPTPIRSVEVLVDFDGATAPGFVLDDVPDEVLAEADAGARVLNLEVHLDLDGDGGLSPGDLVTLAAHPVTGTSATGPARVALVRL